MTPRTRAAAPMLLALVPALLALATPRASALVAVLGPINANFDGSGQVAAGTFGPYDTEFTANGAPTLDLSGLSFASDVLTLDYSPPTILLFAQPSAVSVDRSFVGTDILTTTAGRTLDLSLAGTFSGPSGSVGGVGGSTLVFTGNATVTGGTLGLSGSAPVTLTQNQVALTAALPAGGVGSHQQPNGPASFTSVYGRLNPAVPEPSAFALLGLGLLPVGLLARKRRRA